MWTWLKYSLSILCLLAYVGMATASSSLHGIKHVVVIVLENTSAKQALAQPFLHQLTTQGAYLANYHAVTHPSQPNYIALIAGDTLGVNSNDAVSLKQKQIGDLLQAKHFTWKNYAEGYPGQCFLGGIHEAYYRKHVPFLSFYAVQQQANVCANVVPAETFFTDLRANQLPTFALYTPDINNDGHDTGVAFADKYVAERFGAILSNPVYLRDTLFIITFDEDDSRGDNRVYTVLLGASVKPASQSSQYYTHYSLLKTIEQLFNLGDLGRYDHTSRPIEGIWRAGHG